METFENLLTRLQNGDRAAADIIVRRLEPQIRRAVRLRLLNVRLRRIVDSTDICQSILVRFFRKLATGDFEVGSQQDAQALLITMARNRVIDWVRKQRPEEDRYATEFDTPPRAPRTSEPELIATARDELRDLYTRLPVAEQMIAQQRAAGLSWADIAAVDGGTADAVRVRFARALRQATPKGGAEFS